MLCRYQLRRGKPVLSKACSAWNNLLLKAANFPVIASLVLMLCKKAVAFSKPATAFCKEEKLR